MEPASQSEEGVEALVAQIRECFGRVVYTTKTHEKSADLCTSRFGWIKIGQIVLSALVTGGLLAALLGDPRTSRIAAISAAVLSTALLVVNAYMKDVDPGQQAEKHKEIASKLWDVRESYLSLLTDLHDGQIDLITVRERRDELQARLGTIYVAAPRTSARAYGIASVGLKDREELTFSDDEIDKFLPEALRKSEHSTAST